MQLSAFIYSPAVLKFVQGMFVGVAATFIVGFTWGGWVFGSTAESQVSAATQASVVRVLAPICAENFRRTADAEARLQELMSQDSWTRSQALQKAGWVTFPGSEPNSQVAYACIDMLTK